MKEVSEILGSLLGFIRQTRRPFAKCCRKVNGRTCLKVFVKTNHKFNPQPLRYSLLIELKMKKIKSISLKAVITKKSLIFMNFRSAGMRSVRAKLLSSVCCSSAFTFGSLNINLRSAVTRIYSELKITVVIASCRRFKNSCIIFFRGIMEFFYLLVHSSHR